MTNHHEKLGSSPVDEVRHYEIWDKRVPLTGTQILVWCALRSFGEKIFPSQRRLAERARLGIRTVNKAVGELRKAGFLATTSRGKSLRYRLTIPHEFRNPKHASDAEEMRTKRAALTQPVRMDPKSVKESNNSTLTPRNRSSSERAPTSSALTSLMAHYRKTERELDQGDPLRRELERRGLSKSQSAKAAIRLAELTLRSGQTVEKLLEGGTASRLTATDVANPNIVVDWEVNHDDRRAMRSMEFEHPEPESEDWPEEEEG